MEHHDRFINTKVRKAIIENFMTTTIIQNPRVKILAAPYASPSLVEVIEEMERDNMRQTG